MKNAIAVFIKEHPFLTYFIIKGGYDMVRWTIVGVSQALTGNYPPETPKGDVDINIGKPEEAEEDSELTEVEGEVADILA